MTIFDLSDGRRIAVRPSGTEPKIKYYLFGKNIGVSPDSLNEVKASLAANMETLWDWLQEDARKRVGED
jgi:phosphoglucomutase